MSPSEAATAPATLREAAEELRRAAADRERALALDGELLAELLAAATRAYAARRVAGDDHGPLAGAGAAAPTATDVAITVAAMLEDAGIELFELGLWQTWGDPGSTPRPQGRA